VVVSADDEGDWGIGGIHAACKRATGQE
jgi:hypothetical protein